MKIEERPFGTTSGGRDVRLFILQSASGVRAEIISCGATLKSLRTPDRTGASGEITAGFDTLAEYEANRGYFGATVGRFANRIAGARFRSDGVIHTLAANEGRNHLHGGVRGFDRAVWDAQLFRQADMASIAFSLLSPDGEEGYPGELRITVVYTLTDTDELSIAYEAEADETTPVNPTNHTYWNLAGPASGTIDNHELELRCPFFLPVDEELLPTGEILSVRGTPMDFTVRKRIGPEVCDHCFVIEPGEDDVRTAAVLRDPGSGRKMEILTGLPGIQFYTGNLIPDIRTAGGVELRRRGALCLETGFFPDSVNRPHFRSPFIAPGETYRSITVHRFGVD